MKTIHRATHILCLPWLAALILWGVMWLPLVGDPAFLAFIVFQNFFAHEWYGRVILGISMVTLAYGVFTKPHSKATLAFFVVYAIVLVLFAVWTVWWGVTGQQYHSID